MKRWTPEEIELLGKLTDDEIAAQTGRSLRSVKLARYARGRDSPTRAPNAPRVWSPAELSMLGTVPDATIAKQLGVSRKHVLEMRKRLDIPNHRYYLPEEPQEGIPQCSS